MVTAAQRNRRRRGLGPGEVATPAKPMGLGSYKYKPQDSNVANNVAAVVNQGGPLMQLARTEGLKQAQRRGLGSSSIAVGAAQNEVIKAAAPIGMQEAQQRFEANRSDQDYQEDVSNRNLDFRHDRILGRESDNRALRRQRDAQDFQRELATWNLDASDRERVATTMTSINQTYESALDAINKNKNLKADVRADQIKALTARRDNQLKRLQALYGIKVDLTW